MSVVVMRPPRQGIDQLGGGGEQAALGEGGAEQGDADRAPVGRRAGRDGEGGEVEQVRELRVAAEHEVAGHRLRGELGAGEGGGHGRQQQDVRALPDPRARGPQLLQAVPAAEGVDGGEVAPLLDDVADHRQDGVGVRLEERLSSASRSATHGPV